MLKVVEVAADGVKSVAESSLAVEETRNAAVEVIAVTMELLIVVSAGAFVWLAFVVTRVVSVDIEDIEAALVFAAVLGVRSIDVATKDALALEERASVVLVDILVG